MYGVDLYPQIFYRFSIKMVVSCWMEDHPYINYIYKFPCIFSVVINILFLVMIVIKLVTMLQSDVSDRSATIKTTKAIGKDIWKLSTLLNGKNRVTRIFILDLSGIHVVTFIL